MLLESHGCCSYSHAVGHILTWIMREQEGGNPSMFFCFVFGGGGGGGGAFAMVSLNYC